MRFLFAGGLLLLFSGLLQAASSQSDWSRFLDQANFGPTPAEIDVWAKQAPVAWIQDQASLPPTLYPSLPPYPSNSNGVPSNRSGLHRLYHSKLQHDPLQVQFFQNALNAPDQLRQRVAFSLSQILVVSTNIQTPTTLGWGFFLCAPARPREHARNAE